MDSKRFLAIDLGASSGRTIVGTVVDGCIELEETHRFENAIVERDGHKRWDVERLEAEIRHGITLSGVLDGMAVDTWGVDYGLIDANGDLLEDPFAYRDSRHAAGMSIAMAKVPQVDQYAICGIQAISINSIYQLVAESAIRPNHLNQAAQLLFMPDFFTWKLTGKMMNEYTIASTSGLLDASSRDWARNLIDRLGLPRGLFGEIGMPGDAIGDYEGTPVYLVGGHDTACAVAAVPSQGDDWAYLSSGTWSLIGVETDAPILTPEACEANFTNEGGISGTVRFLKNVTGLWLIQECRRMWADSGQVLSFAEIADAAETSEFSGIFLPNDDRFTAPENMVEEIRAYFIERGGVVPESVGDVARACYQSLASAYAEQLAVLRELTGKDINRLHVVGGGSQAALLNQMTANACGISVIAGPVEATALGNVGIQAMANGLIPDLNALRVAVANSVELTTYKPA